MTSTPIMQLFIKTLVANFWRPKKCDDVGVSLRPHIKTLHHPSIADQLKSLGLNKICVSNIDMLRLFWLLDTMIFVWRYLARQHGCLILTVC